MIIGFDADDVIFDTGELLISLLDEIGDERLLELRAEIMRGDVTIPEVRGFLDTYFTPVIKDIRPKEHVKEVIDNLKQAGHEVAIVTARGNKSFADSEEATRHALMQNEIECDFIVYDSHDKAKDCMEKGVEIFVDDSPKHCLAVAETGIPVIGFLSEANKEEFEKSGLLCVSDWWELERELERMGV